MLRAVRPETGEEPERVLRLAEGHQTGRPEREEDPEVFDRTHQGSSTWLRVIRPETGEELIRVLRLG
jgi:hypothetical protein